MRTINKVFLLGNLGADPELRYTGEGRAVGRFNVATRTARKRDDGEWEEETEWHRVVTFGPLAERCAQHLRKGQPAMVEGRAHRRTYEDNGEKKFIHQVIAREVVFFSTRPASEEAPTPQPARPEPPPADGADVPF